MSAPGFRRIALRALLCALPLTAGDVDAAEHRDRQTEGWLAPPVQARSAETESPADGKEARVEPVLAGEPVNGFPNWGERVLHEWVNRARVAPQVEMAACGSNCPDAACYSVVAPLIWNGNVARAARFHADEMLQQSYFAHPSACTVVSNINSLYPGSCNGSAACACVGGTKMCNPTCTAWNARIALFGTSGGGENIAGGYGSVDSAFYAWLHEPATSSACVFTMENGHRWNILTQGNAIGMGVSSALYVNDFGGSNSPIPKIPSGAHYPQQASPIEFWANWYDTAAPSAASVDVDGVCQTMSLSRGTGTNGAWSVSVTGLQTGCHRYYFTFRDSSGTEITYPSTGSFGIGTSGCADWDATRPASCTGGPAGPRFHTMTPCRLADTRNPDGPFGGPALAAAETRSFTVSNGGCGIPADAVGISLNVTVADATAGGSLNFFPGSGTEPDTNTITFVPGKNRANTVTIGLTTGVLSVRNHQTAGAVNLILDVNGYYR
jgi:hypothetical protein